MPANDECATAIALTIGGGDITYDNTLATGNGTDPVPANWDAICAPDSKNTVWYTFTVAGPARDLTISSQGDGSNVEIEKAEIAVFSGTCGALVEMASASFDSKRINLTSVGPGTYYIMTDGHCDKVGNFKIRVDDTPTGSPTLWYPAGAIPTLNAGIPVTDDGQWGTYAADPEVDATCATGLQFSDYYQFVYNPTFTSGLHVTDHTLGTSLVMVLYDNLENEVACVDAGIGAGPPSFTADTSPQDATVHPMLNMNFTDLGLITGQTYYVRLASKTAPSYNVNTAGRTYTLAVGNFAPPADIFQNNITLPLTCTWLNGQSNLRASHSVALEPEGIASGFAIENSLLYTFNTGTLTNVDVHLRNITYLNTAASTAAGEISIQTFPIAGISVASSTFTGATFTLSATGLAANTDYWIVIDGGGTLGGTQLGFDIAMTGVDLGPNQTVCPGSTVILDAGAGPGLTYLWNDGSMAQTLNVTGTGSYSVTVTYPDGCQSSDAVVVTFADAIPPNVVTQDITVMLDATGNGSITAAMIDNGSTDNCGVGGLSLDVSAFTCADLGANTVTLTVTDVNGNMASNTATVTVQDNIAPNVVTQDITVQLDGTGNATIVPADIDNGSSDPCGPLTLGLDVSSFTCADLGANTVTLTVTDQGSNNAMGTATVTVEDNIDPVAVGQNITVQLDAAGTVTVAGSALNNGSTDNCGITSESVSPNSFSCANIGPNPATYTVQDASGNMHSVPVTITVEDDLPPLVTANDITVQLNAGGVVGITAGDVLNASSDNCGVASLNIDVGFFTCANIGPNTVTLTATDFEGNMGMATSTVTVEDNIDPNVITQNITVNLDPTGNVTIAATDIDNGSTDNCGPPALSLDITSFTCANIGANTVTLTATDGSGNSAMNTATVTVQDVAPPVVVTQDITVQLDGSGNVSITPADIDNGSSDNCGIASRSLDITSFTCADIGANTVTLTVTDNFTNSDNATATVTVEDNIDPVAVAQNINVFLDGTGNASIVPADVDNGSSDNCGVATLGLDITTFTCADIGPNTVTLTATDGSGNSNNTTATVTVLDNIAPNVVTQNITVQLDATGNATITTTDIDNGTTDNCSVNSLSLDITSFGCGDIGANTVMLTATDPTGNSASAAATVTVEDNIDPVVVTMDITIQLNGAGTATITPADINNGSTDNCGISTFGLSQNSFTCADLGANTVTLTATDAAGNSAMMNATVTVEDNIAPTVVTQNIIVPLDATGNATITPGMVDNGTSDNCGINSLALDQTTFTCTDLGANTVTLTAMDATGNSDNNTATVTIVDFIVPTAIPQDITVQLDATGNVTVNPIDLDNGSLDNCAATLNFSLNISSFTCANIGPNAVTFTATDASGNNHSAPATITVEDNLPPAIITQDITVQLDASGNVSITPGDIDNGSNDNCSPTNLSLDITSFTCADLGANTVTLTGMDALGNSDNATATVTVEDNLAPTVTTQNITVQLDATGNVTISPADIDNGTSDNCSVAGLSLDVMAFTCADVGANTVTLTATDPSGNSGMNTATVTVEDNILPTALAQDITVQLDATGNVTITPAAIDNGSSDNCSINTLALDVSAFTCADIGANNVVLTVTDPSGNSSDANAVVTVEDNLAPTVITQDITVQLDATGNVSITTGDIDNGSNDNCNIATLGLDVTNFTCADIGANTVTLTATDDSGNSDNATAVVTVEDNILPTVVTQDITIQLDATGNATIVPADIDNGSSDNCSGLVLGLDISAFTCAEVGPNTVMLSATDAGGATVQSAATVTVEDNIGPVAVAQDITVQLDNTGNVIVNPIDVDNGSSDNCSIATFALDITNFDCDDLGANPVVLTVTDPSGNSAMANATITVEDNVSPTVGTQDITVSLDATGNVTILPADVDNGTNNNCNLPTLSLDINSFTCAEIGPNVVMLTATDNSGNSASAPATVTVVDDLAPVILTQDITVQLDATGNASIVPGDIDNGTADNCALGTFSLDISTFTCADLGPNTVTFTATDASGNNNNATATVTVTDIIDPITTTQNITVQLDATGNVSILPGDVDNGSTDNCIIQNQTLDISSFTCAEIGPNTVQLTTTDDSGNNSSQTATVTVEDNLAPNIATQDITVQLDATGNVTISAMDVDNGSSDNCSVNLGLDITAFTCAELGPNTVTLTGTDPSTNSANATATVTVVDDLNPTVVTQDITVQLDPTGNISIVPADVDNGTSDNCSVASLTLDITDFDCSDLGNNTVTLTATDGSGNSADDTAIVTVVDNEAPVATTQDITVQLDNTGMVSIVPADVDNGSSDNCVVNLSLDVTDFTCANLGANTVTLTATDADGNSNNATATVTVEDNLPPSITSQDLTVQLDATGNASITAMDIDNGSSDNCSLASLSLDVTDFTCGELGTNLVTLTGTDAFGNSQTASAVVTVEDVTAPTINCPSSIVIGNDLGVCGASISIPIPAASDNCSVQSVTNDITASNDASAFYPIGITTVTYTVSDASGNQTQCSFTVEVTDQEVPTPANAGPDVIVCDPVYTMQGNNPVVGAGSWTVVSGSATIDDPANPNANLSQIGQGVNIFEWTVTGTCQTSSDQVTVEFQLLILDAGSDVTISDGEQVLLQATNDRNEPGTYSWSPTTWLSDPNIADPVATPLQTTTYTVTFTNQDGCTTTDDITITVDTPNMLGPIKGVSPDGDGINDFWRIVGINAFPQNQVKIFNRWGNVVWETAGYNNFDRVFVGTGNQLTSLGADELPEGTYFYSITLGDGTDPLQGFFVLKR